MLPSLQYSRGFLLQIGVEPTTRARLTAASSSSHCEVLLLTLWSPDCLVKFSSFAKPDVTVQLFIVVVIDGEEIQS